MGEQIKGDERLGRINYSGYCEALPKKVTWDGQPLPVWRHDDPEVKQLGEVIRAAWQGGAEAVARDATAPVYLERARVLALATKALQAMGVRCGLGRHEANDPTWDPAYSTIVFVDLPAGQVSWHVHDSEVKLFAHLPPYEAPWDGHTTPAKYARVEAFCSGPIPLTFASPDVVSKVRSGLSAVACGEMGDARRCVEGLGEMLGVEPWGDDE